MPTRRLAAIMFTDIAGYTKLMQESEARANELRSRHREVFENTHQAYNGQIVQYFGDGTLSTFESCVEAVQCAIKMQGAFQEEPKVPLRIGIHLGDIVWSDKDVMGDGVNLASRVESLGVPGSILISDDVNKQIKNQEIETVNMGTFGMKNVDTPLEVFAVKADGVVIPSPKDLKGKGKRLNNILKARRLLQFANVGFLAMAIGALIFWASGAQERSQLLPESIREEKVAVSVFENFTGDENLDALGYLGSEWISSGLRELKVRTVSPEMVRRNKKHIGVLPDNPKGEPSFAEITGAKYVISGSYFLQGDSLVLNTRLSSTETGEELRAFPKLIGHKNQKEDLVEEARQYLLGYWVLRRDQKLPTITPPKYEAYQAYLKCFPSDYKCYQNVLDIDPNFLLARVYLLGASVSWDNDSLYQATKMVVEQKWDQCTAFERNIFNEAVFMWEGNYQAAFEAYDANYQLDPEDYLSLHQSAYLASAGLNRTDIALERYEKLFAKMELFKDKIDPATSRHYLDALNRQLQYTGVTNFYDNLSDDLKVKFNNQASNEVIIALIAQNRIADLKKLITQRGSTQSDLIRAAYVYAYVNPDSAHNTFATELRSRLNDFDDPLKSYQYKQGTLLYLNNWDSRATAYYILKDWDKAEEILLELRELDWESYFGDNGFWDHCHPIFVETLLGSIYAQKGQKTLALAQLKRVQQIGTQYHNNHHSPFFKGITPYLMARIYAVLGKKERAVDLLEKSLAEGNMYIWWRFTLDLDFVNLKGYPPFEALIAPRNSPIQVN